MPGLSASRGMHGASKRWQDIARINKHGSLLRRESETKDRGIQEEIQETRGNRMEECRDEALSRDVPSGRLGTAKHVVTGKTHGNRCESKADRSADWAKREGKRGSKGRIFLLIASVVPIG